MKQIVFFALAACAFAVQAQQRPLYQTTKVDGTEGVYIFRNGNHQSMFVVTKDGVIATVPIGYGRPTGGQQYVDEIKKVTRSTCSHCSASTWRVFPRRSC